MATRQTATQRMIHECRILEDDTSTADSYGHNASFSSAVRATGVACRYYEESGNINEGEINYRGTVAKLIIPFTQNLLTSDRIDSIVDKGQGTSVVSGTFEILAMLTRPTHKILTIRKLSET